MTDYQAFALLLASLRFRHKHHYASCTELDLKVALALATGLEKSPGLSPSVGTTVPDMSWLDEARKWDDEGRRRVAQLLQEAAGAQQALYAACTALQQEFDRMGIHTHIDPKDDFSMWRKKSGDSGD